MPSFHGEVVVSALRLVLAAALVLHAAACAGDGSGSGLAGLDVTASRDGAPRDAEADDDDVPLDAPVAAPRLVLDPAELEFEWVLLGQSSVLPLTLHNEGELTLTVQPPTIVFATTPFVDLPDAPNGLFTVAPREATHLQVRFAPTELFPPRNDPIAFVRLATNDPVTPEVDVPVYGRTTEATSPDLRVEPSVLDLGNVPYGTATFGKVTLRNQGNRALRITSVTIEEPDSLFEVVADPAFPPTLGAESAFDLDPGGDQAVHVRFDAADAALLPGPVTGTLVITSDDPQQPKYGVPLTVEIVGPGTCPLTIATAPPLEFGSTTVGCRAGSRLVRLESSIEQATRVTSVIVKEGCASLFPLLLPEAMPIELAGGSSWVFGVDFAPVAVGPASCVLTVRADGCADLFLGLHGQGVLTSSSYDTFVQHAAAKVDVLLVVDGSASMAAALERLAAGAIALLTALESSHVDYHVGVIGAGIDPACPQTATLLTNPPVISSADHVALAAALSPAVLTPCGAGSVWAGLEAMRRALSAPLTTDLATPCAGLADCPAGYACHEGTCGGPNRGFLRPDAELRVLFVSDTDDASDDPPGEYVAFLAALEGPVEDSHVDVHAVVGPLPSGCAANDVVAAPGARYLQVVQATGGSVTSVCAPDFTSALATLGTASSPVQTTFPLSSFPAPGTVHVWLDGVECHDGWWLAWDEAAVDVDPEGPCLPPPGSTVTITYDRLCLGE